jgi:hypothetical protein
MPNTVLIIATSTRKRLGGSPAQPWRGAKGLQYKAITAAAIVSLDAYNPNRYIHSLPEKELS